MRVVGEVTVGKTLDRSAVECALMLDPRDAVALEYITRFMDRECELTGHPHLRGRFTSIGIFDSVDGRTNDANRVLDGACFPVHILCLVVPRFPLDAKLVELLTACCVLASTLDAERVPL